MMLSHTWDVEFFVDLDPDNHVWAEAQREWFRATVEGLSPSKWDAWLDLALRSQQPRLARFDLSEAEATQLHAALCSAMQDHGIGLWAGAAVPGASCFKTCRSSTEQE